MEKHAEKNTELNHNNHNEFIPNSLTSNDSSLNPNAQLTASLPPQI